MMIEVNLLPGAYKKSALSIDVGQYTDYFKTQLQDKYLLGALVLVIVAVTASLAGHLSQSVRAAGLDDRATVVAKDSARFATILSVRSQAQASRDSVYQQLAIIRSIDNMRYTWAHLLEEVNLALPAYTWLTTVTQTSSITTTATDDTTKVSSSDSTHPSKTTAAHKRARADSLFHGSAIPTRFRIIGQTVDVQALTLFMKNLEASPFIRSVQLSRSDLVVSNGKEVTEFQLEAESETPANAFIQTIPLKISVE